MKDTWQMNRDLISDLWPNYEPTEAETTVIARRLSPLRQDWLAQAIADHRTDDATGRFKPDAASIIRRYRMIAESGSLRDTTERRDGWRAGWTEMHEGRPVAKASASVFGSEHEALTFAERMCAAGPMHNAGESRHTPCAFRIAEGPDIAADDFRAVETDDIEATDLLLRATGETVKAAIAWCRENAVLGGDELDPDPRKWTRFARGVVCAAMTNKENRR